MICGEPSRFNTGRSPSHSGHLFCQKPVPTSLGSRIAPRKQATFLSKTGMTVSQHTAPKRDKSASKFAPAQRSSQPAGFFDGLREAYSLDLRSLALFRIALGAMILIDLVMRAVDLNVFYT